MIFKMEAPLLHVDVFRLVVDHLNCCKTLCHLIQTNKHYYEMRSKVPWDDDRPLWITPNMTSLSYYNQFRTIVLSPTISTICPSFVTHISVISQGYSGQYKQFGDQGPSFLKSMYIWPSMNLEDVNDLFCNKTIKEVHLSNFESLDVVWPSGVEKLSIDNSLNFLSKGCIPDTVKHLEFLYYDGPLDPGVLHEGLETLDLGEEYYMPFHSKSFPKTLKVLKLSKQFNRELKVGDLPERLEELYFGKYYNQPIKPGVLPDSLLKINFGTTFNIPMSRIHFPKNIKKIKLACSNYAFAVNINDFPESLEKLTISKQYQYCHHMKLKTPRENPPRVKFF